MSYVSVCVAWASYKRERSFWGLGPSNGIIVCPSVDHVSSNRCAGHFTLDPSPEKKNAMICLSNMFE